MGIRGRIMKEFKVSEFNKKHKITSYHVEERSVCKIHGRMTQVPCTMYMYCIKCEDEKEVLSDGNFRSGGAG